MSPVSPTRWRIVALLAVSSLVLVSCGGDEKAKQPTGGETVTIGFVGALTGANASLGTNMRDGAKLAVDEENEKAKGPRIALKEFDTRGDPAEAAAVRDRLVADQSVVAIVGPGFSGETKEMIPALQQAGLVMISPSATNRELTTVVPDSTVFHRIVADDSMQAAGITEYLVKERPRSVAYVHDNTADGKGLTDEVEKLATSRGIVKSTTAVLDPNAPDFSATVNTLKAANPTTIFFGGYYAEGGRLKKQLTDAGVNSSFLSGDKSLDAGFVVAAGPAAAEGARLTCSCHLATAMSKDKKLKKFATTYTMRIGKDPGVYSPEAYDAATLLIKGIQMGSKDRPAMLQYVETLKNFSGTSKPVEFEPNGNLISKKKTFVVFQVKMGRIEELQEVKIP